jgi:4-hydroxy-L-threonine phosphate dehydrogenase PdxA
MNKPTLALFTGDPAGIGPELVQKLLLNPAVEKAGHVFLIGQKGSIQTPTNVEWHEGPPWCATARPMRFALRH